MSHSKKSWVVGLLVLCFSSSVLADQVRLKSGEMGILNFLEMVSDQLDLQIDASELGASTERVAVPETGLLTSERAKALVLSFLYLQGYTWIHDSATDLYRVMRQRDARDQEVPVISDLSKLPDSDLLVTYIMKIEHTPPEYIARNLRSFMGANSRIIPDDTTSSVLITDSAHNIAKLQKLVEKIDTPQAAKQAKEWLAAIAKNAEVNCAATGLSGGNVAPTYPPGVLIALFSLIALVIGFLARGYVIRRIEGGL